MITLWLENRSAQNTLLWTYILVLLPVLGYIFYVYSGQLQFKGERFKDKRNSERKLFEALSKKQRPLDLSVFNNHQRCFANYLERVTLTDQNKNTKTKILINGEETFQEIKQKLKEGLKSFIHLEYYIFRYDRLGQEPIEILMSEKCKQLKNRDIELSFSSKSEIKKIEESGIKIQPFLPIKTGWYNQKFNFRNHQNHCHSWEDWICRRTKCRGRLLGEDDEFGFWCDTHVVLEGVKRYMLFLLDWKYVCGERLFDERYMKPVSTVGDGLVHVVATGPETGDMGRSFAIAMISTCATESIWMLFNSKG